MIQTIFSLTITKLLNYLDETIFVNIIIHMIYLELLIFIVYFTQKNKTTIRVNMNLPIEDQNHPI